MQQLRDMIEAEGLAPHDLVIAGRMSLKFGKRTTNVYDEECDEWVPYVADLSISRAGQVVQHLDATSEAFVELAKTLTSVVRLPLHAVFVPVDAAGPAETASFSYPYGMIDALAKADDVFFEALITGNAEQLNEVAWTRFQHTAEFAQGAWTRDAFIALKREYAASDYAIGLGLNEYIGWFMKSAEALDPSGALKPEVVAQAESMLDAWSETDTEGQKFWLSRNLEVHPRHQALYGQLVDDRLAAKAPGMGR
ncbi:hypothetical protein [Bosea sp. RAC05]|uniref:hypothetical protein n=1 Tax=Bosea sp. RAC05 TaxID=1842539 RepID=UPI00083CE6B3|nr:hypothetical protein [Bosea sp. RAC05]AOG03286.1 hypothetical protein BSY19_4799 [Bosea sp. RAC05]